MHNLKHPDCRHERRQRVHFEMENIALRNSIDRILLPAHPKLVDRILDQVEAFMARKRRKAA